MWKAALAGAVVLALGSSVASAENAGTDFNQSGAIAKSEAALSFTQVARLKAALKLTQAQEQLWLPVERAFREISQAQGGGSQGLMQSLKHRVSSIGLNALALRRLAAAAYPLIRTLNEEQKQSATAFARSAGLESVAAAF